MSMTSPSLLIQSVLRASCIVILLAGSTVNNLLTRLEQPDGKKMCEVNENIPLVDSWDKAVSERKFTLFSKGIREIFGTLTSVCKQQ